MLYIEPNYLAEDSKYIGYIEELNKKGLIKQVYEENSYYLLELNLLN